MDGHLHYLLQSSRAWQSIVTTEEELEALETGWGKCRPFHSSRGSWVGLVVEGVCVCVCVYVLVWLLFM